MENTTETVCSLCGEIIPPYKGERRFTGSGTPKYVCRRCQYKGYSQLAGRRREYTLSEKGKRALFDFEKS